MTSIHLDYDALDDIWFVTAWGHCQPVCSSCVLEAVKEIMEGMRADSQQEDEETN